MNLSKIVLNDEVTAVIYDKFAHARIDSLSKLQAGSTTGDAELQDIRIKADGETANTAGEAVREQINGVNDSISQLSKNKVSKTDIVDNLESTDTNKPLSANQGKVLNDGITQLNSELSKKHMLNENIKVITTNASETKIIINLAETGHNLFQILISGNSGISNITAYAYVSNTTFRQRTDNEKTVPTCDFTSKNITIPTGNYALIIIKSFYNDVSYSKA